LIFQVKVIGEISVLWTLFIVVIYLEWIKLKAVFEAKRSRESVGTCPVLSLCQPLPK